MTPWNVRVAMAFHDNGQPVAPYLLMAIQIQRNGFGCTAGCR